MNKLLAVIALCLCVSGAQAGPFGDGFVAMNRGDFSTALRLWASLVNQGDAYTQNQLGVMYAKGEGVLAPAWN